MTNAPPKPKRPARRRAAEPRPAPAANRALPDFAPPDFAPPDFALPDFAPLATTRLTLRSFRPDDAAELHRLINDFEVASMLAMVPFPYPRELADQWIASHAAGLAAGTAIHLAITGQEGDRETLAGAAGLAIDPAGRSARLGYWVGRAFWGHGVATEAAARLTSWALANLEIDRIAASVATDNPASAAVLRRIGFRATGEGVEHFTSRRGETPVLRFEATRDDIFGHTVVASTEPGAKPLLLVAACALVDSDGRVLLARRPEGKKMAGLWEFPGGKLNQGETPEQALIRELKEELGIDVSAACLAPFAFASHAYDGFHLLMPLFLCRRWKGIPSPREGQTLAWVAPRRLVDYEMPPADKPLIPLLRDFL